MNLTFFYISILQASERYYYIAYLGRDVLKQRCLKPILQEANAVHETNE